MNNTLYVNTSQQGIPVNQKIIYLISESIIWQKCCASLLETYRVAVIYYWYMYLSHIRFFPTLVHSEMHKSHILSCSQTVSVTCCFNSARNLSVIDVVYQPIKIFEWCLFSAEAPAVAWIRAFIQKNLSLCGENQRERDWEQCVISGVC